MHAILSFSVNLNDLNTSFGTKYRLHEELAVVHRNLIILNVLDGDYLLGTLDIFVFNVNLAKNMVTSEGQDGIRYRDKREAKEFVFGIVETGRGLQILDIVELEIRGNDLIIAKRL